MKKDYNKTFSIRVKARAHYACEKCGSTEYVQAHAPNGDHSDWRKGIALCAAHHADEHPSIPRELFFIKNHQPYWLNISASSLAKELGCHSRTIIRAARRFGIACSISLSEENRTRIIKYVTRYQQPDYMEQKKQKGEYIKLNAAERAKAKSSLRHTERAEQQQKLCQELALALTQVYQLRDKLGIPKYGSARGLNAIPLHVLIDQKIQPLDKEKYENSKVRY